MLVWMEKFLSIPMMTKQQEDCESLVAHLYDLKDQSETWHKSIATNFLNDEEQAAMKKVFPEGKTIRYDGGYPGARKKEVIFLYEEEDDFSNIQCLHARIDQRFRKIGHRDVLGALMHLQIDSHSFGDFWVEEKDIYLYTTDTMADFLIANLIRINQLSVSFEKIEEHPIQQFKQKRFEAIVASERMDAIVAGITHLSRSESKNLIRQGLVQMDHVSLEEPDRLAYNNVTISIRGYGRFTYVGTLRETRNGRIVAEFLQDI